MQLKKVGSSANRYRKHFRYLVREKGSIGKAYQTVRREIKSNGLRAAKQLLKNTSHYHSLQHTEKHEELQSVSIKEGLNYSFIYNPTTFSAEHIFKPKIAIIGELSIVQCTKYRVTQKQEMFENLGISCSVTSWTDIVEAKKQISLASLVIFYRVPAFDGVLSLIDECHRLNIKCLWETDDLIFDEELLRQSKTIQNMSDERVKQELFSGALLYRRAMLACDGAIVSTTIGLAEAIKNEGIREVYTIENALDKQTIDIMEKQRQKINKGKDNEKIIIIYGSGSNTHNEDFLEVAPALAKILHQHSNVIFRIVGYLDLPEYFHDLSRQIERIDFCSYSEYFAYLAESDISIAPLEDSIFNDAKSNIKYIEASIMEVASICSPRKEFVSVIENGKNGLLANSEQEWVNAFNLLISNKELREEIAKAANYFVNHYYCTDNIAKKLLPMLSEFKPLFRKPKLLAINTYYRPQSFGGATVVAEQINDLLIQDDFAQLYVITTLPPSTELPAYHVVRYEQNQTTIFGIAVPNQDFVYYGHSRVDAIVYEIVKLIQTDIVHIHCVQGLGVGILDICKEEQIKTVLTLHDAWWICQRQFMITAENKFCNQWKLDSKKCLSCVKDMGKYSYLSREYIVKQALKLADVIVAPSKYFVNLHNVNLDVPIVLNQNGIKPPMRIRNKFKSNKIIRFGYVGGNTKIKGIHLILEAFRQYCFDNTELIIVDNLLNLGERSYHHNDIQGISRCRIVPAYTQDNIDEFFSSIDILLFPTQWKESFGLTVREAIMRNVWVIATDAGSVVEDIIDGENGTIIPFDSDVARLAQAIQEVCDRYQSIPFGSKIDLPKSHIHTFEEQKNELVNIYTSLLN